MATLRGRRRGGATGGGGQPGGERRRNRRASWFWTAVATQSLRSASARIAVSGEHAAVVAAARRVGDGGDVLDELVVLLEQLVGGELVVLLEQLVGGELVQYGQEVPGVDHDPVALADLEDVAVGVLVERRELSRGRRSRP